MTRKIFIENLQRAGLDRDEYEAVVDMYDILTEGLGADFVNFMKPKNFFGKQKEGTIRKYALGAATGALIGGAVGCSNMNSVDDNDSYVDDKHYVSYCDELTPEQQMDSNYVACLDRAPEIDNDSIQQYEKNVGIHDDSLLVDYMFSNLADTVKAKYPSVKDRQNLVKKIYSIVKEVSKVTEQYCIGPAELIALMCVESHFDPNALSQTGFKGLMQLGEKAIIDARENRASLLNVSGKSNPFDIEDAIYLGASYLHRLMYTTGRSYEVSLDVNGVERDIKHVGNFEYALATYNGGIGTPIAEFPNKSIPQLYRHAMKDPSFMAKGVSIPKLKEPLEYPGKILRQLDAMRAKGISTYFASDDVHYRR